MEELWRFSSLNRFVSVFRWQILQSSHFFDNRELTVQGFETTITTGEEGNVKFSIQRGGGDCLLHLVQGTCLDIAVEVSIVARFCSNPEKEQWTVIKRIVCDQKGKVQMRLTFRWIRGKLGRGFVAAVGLGWRSGFEEIGNGVSLFRWWHVDQLGKQITMDTFTQLCANWMHVTCFGFKKHGCCWGTYCRKLSLATTPTFQDNQACIDMSQHKAHHSKTKHIDLKYHFVRHYVTNHTVKSVYLRTSKMVGDLLTKPRRQVLFDGSCRRLVISKDRIEKQCCRVWVIGMTRLRGCWGICVVFRKLYSVFVFEQRKVKTPLQMSIEFSIKTSFTSKTLTFLVERLGMVLVVRTNCPFLNFLFIWLGGRKLVCGSPLFGTTVWCS